MVYLYTSMIFFAIGVVIACFNKRVSYFMAGMGGVFAFVASIIGMNHNFHSSLFTLMNRIQMQIGLSRTNSLFLTIASISLSAIAFYSIDYGKDFSKKMALSLNISFFGMLLVLTAQDSLTFLIGWEVATIFLYLLILEHKDSFKEAFSFLAFGEVSTLSLTMAFALLFVENGSFSLIGINVSDLALLVASLGFIVKMDIFPFHTWISKTYPKSPSNVAAMLSAPLTMVSAYGLIKILSVSNKPEWFGITAILLGGFSAFWGGLQAAAAKKLKLLPAYSTVENNGMILAVIGLSVIAYNANITALSNFAILTSIILIFAHTITKTLLFLSIGHAKKALGEDSIDDVRGIWSSVGKIPAIGILSSSLSFSAFPPFIGFVGEWMLLEAVFQSYKFSSILSRLSAAFSGILMALAMGLAAFSMVKLAGYTSIGYDHEKKARKISSNFMVSMEAILTFIIFLSGFLSPLLIKYIGYGDFLYGLLGVPKPYLIVSSHPIFGVVSPTFLTLVVGILFIFPMCFFIFKKSKVRKVNAFNGGEILKEEEYFSVPAYSFILEYILRKVYSTKEIKNGKKRYVTIKDITENFYYGVIQSVKKVSKALSITLMNGHIYYYILYTMITFILIFFVAR